MMIIGAGRVPPALPAPPLNLMGGWCNRCWAHVKATPKGTCPVCDTRLLGFAR